MNCNKYYHNFKLITRNYTYNDHDRDRITFMCAYWLINTILKTVLEGLAVRRLAVIQDKMDATGDSEWEIAMVKFLEIKDMKSSGKWWLSNESAEWGGVHIKKYGAEGRALGIPKERGIDECPRIENDKEQEASYEENQARTL